MQTKHVSQMLVINSDVCSAPVSVVCSLYLSVGGGMHGNCQSAVLILRNCQNECLFKLHTGGAGGGGAAFGSGYGGGYGGGAMKSSGGYSQRGAGPYGG